MAFLFTAAALLCSAAPQIDPSDAAQAPQFEAPVQLTSDGEPLGIKQLYPSPRLYDIDGDGQADMVIGDLFGKVNVAKKPEGGGLAEWGALEPFLSGERPLKFHNW